MTLNNPYPPFDPDEFDAWADGYDEEARRGQGYPFEGYQAVLDEMVRCADVKPGMRILDLGTGTGELALRFAELGCTVWGTDFSPAMLKKARGKSPSIEFVHWDLRQPWPVELDGFFERIVSAYVFHHFSLEKKVALVTESMTHLSNGGRVVIGDLSFGTRAHLERARRDYADGWEEEPYWIAEEARPALAYAGCHARYSQVSNLAGVYCIDPVKDEHKQ